MFRNQRRRGLTLVQTAALVATGGAGALGIGMMITEAELTTLTAQTVANLATVTDGLEAYQVDWGVYPYDGYNYNSSAMQSYNYWFLPAEMTTPTAYVSAEDMFDPFKVFLQDPADDVHWQWRHMRYTNVESTWGTSWDDLQTGTPGSSVYFSDAVMEYGGWRLVVSGPDGIYGPTGWPGVSSYPANPIPYDPTNGVESEGDFVRSTLAPNGYLNLQLTTAVRNHALWR